MEEKLSPSYMHAKLENPTLADLIDVFEDMWRGYVFDQADLLLRSPNGEVAAMTILCSYFEAIGGYLSGEGTNGRSKEFFGRGFGIVFHADSVTIKQAADAIYKCIRCGLAHEGMLNHKVNYSRAGSKPFILTYRKAPDGSLDVGAGVVSIAVNPERIRQGVLHHFEGYILTLRKGRDQVLIDAFRTSFERQMAFGKGENFIGMTEAEFLGTA